MEERSGAMAEVLEALVEVASTFARVEQMHPRIFIDKEIRIKFNKLTEYI